MNVFSGTDFDWFNLAYAFVTLFFTIIMSYETLEKNGWDSAHNFLKANLINYIRWGKNQEIGILFVKVQTYIWYAIFINFVLFFLISKLTFLTFLHEFAVFSMIGLFYALISFGAVSRFKEESKSIFKGISWIAGGILFLISLLMLINGPSALDNFQQHFPSYKIDMSLVYVSALISLVLAWAFIVFSSFLLYWLFLGSIPTITLIILVLMTKSSFVVEMIMRRKKVIVLIIFTLFAIMTFYDQVFKG